MASRSRPGAWRDADRGLYGSASGVGELGELGEEERFTRCRRALPERPPGMRLSRWSLARMLAMWLETVFVLSESSRPIS